MRALQAVLPPPPPVRGADVRPKAVGTHSSVEMGPTLSARPVSLNLVGVFSHLVEGPTSSVRLLDPTAQLQRAVSSVVATPLEARAPVAAPVEAFLEEALALVHLANPRTPVVASPLAACSVEARRWESTLLANLGMERLLARVLANLVPLVAVLPSEVASVPVLEPFPLDNLKVQMLAIPAQASSAGVEQQLALVAPAQVSLAEAQTQLLLAIQLLQMKDLVSGISSRQVLSLPLAKFKHQIPLAPALTSSLEMRPALLPVNL